VKRAILVGAGGMGKAWGQNLAKHPDVEIAAWVDVVPGQAERAAEEVGINAHCYTNLNEAIRDADADFLVDVTIPEAHEEVTVTSLWAGLPVIGEKPLSASMASAKRMLKVSEETGLLYMVSQSRRYNGQLSAFKKLVEQVGNVGIINADFYLGAHFGGFRDVMQSVLLVDMAIHTFDMSRAITGFDPVSVFADEFNPNWSWYQHGSSANVLFDMSDGAKFAYRGSWCADGLHTSWEGDWRIVGSKGTAKWDGHNQIEAAIVETRDTNDFHLPVRHEIAEPIDQPYGIEGSLNEFLNALDTGETPQGECHDNIKSLAMVFAAVESAKRGERVFIEEMLA
jgi:predicted dehydrogenase